MEDIKTGKQIIDEFFSELQNLPDIDEKTIHILQKLHQNAELTPKQIENALRKAREEGVK
jgi:hypothetical protein